MADHRVRQTGKNFEGEGAKGSKHRQLPQSGGVLLVVLSAKNLNGDAPTHDASQ